MNEKRFDANYQLRELLKRYPGKLESADIRIDIFGAILDYIGRSNHNLEQLLLEFPNLYQPLFAEYSQHEEDVLGLLRALLYDLEARATARQATQRHGWVALEGLVDRIDSEYQQKGSPQASSKADLLAKHRVVGVIWQLSDIHFGKLNCIGLDARQLANTLCSIRHESPDFTPALIIVSGDVSTCCSDSELDEFKNFCKYLSEGLWDAYRPYRILVVPGNHETTWLDNGRADGLSRFKKHFGNIKEIVTPFWPSKQDQFRDNYGDVSVMRFTPSGDLESPPFVIVRDKEINIRVVLLVSSYYSGMVPPKVSELLGQMKGDEAKTLLWNLLREDKGEFGRDYIQHIKNLLEQAEQTTIAVTHHNLYQYGDHACFNPDTRVLLSTLAERGVQLIFHGHTHLEEKLSARRPPTPNEAYPVPCPTLCSTLPVGNSCGFMLHLVGPEASPRVISTAVWSFDESKYLNPDSLKLRYRFNVYKNKLTLSRTRGK